MSPLRFCHIGTTRSVLAVSFNIRQNLFLARALPGPRWGADDALPDSLVGWLGRERTPPHTHLTRHRPTFGARHASPPEFQPDLRLWRVGHTHRKCRPTRGHLSAAVVIATQYTVYQLSRFGLARAIFVLRRNQRRDKSAGSDLVRPTLQKLQADLLSVGLPGRNLLPKTYAKIVFFNSQILELNGSRGVTFHRLSFLSVLRKITDDSAPVTGECPC